jgi:hypothetical protein
MHYFHRSARYQLQHHLVLVGLQRAIVANAWAGDTAARQANPAVNDLGLRRHIATSILDPTASRWCRERDSAQVKERCEDARPPAAMDRRRNY